MQTPTCTIVQIQLYAHVCVRLGPWVIVRGLWWECGVGGEMDSFLKESLPSPCMVDMRWVGLSYFPMALRAACRLM